MGSVREIIMDKLVTRYGSDSDLVKTLIPNESQKFYSQEIRSRPSTQSSNINSHETQFQAGNHRNKIKLKFLDTSPSSNCLLIIFTIAIAVIQMTQQAASNYSKSVYTTLEARYHIPALVMGVIRACFHIGSILAIIPVAYFYLALFSKKCV